jgi:DNA helicase HerA-like ATPase
LHQSHFFVLCYHINKGLKADHMPHDFKSHIKNAYSDSGSASICLGGAVFDEEIVLDCHLSIALKTLNRHGLIAGATGTGKTKTIQMLSEQLSSQGVPSLVMDIKGDLSGLAVSGDANEKVLARASKIGLEFNPQAYPVEFLSLDNQPGVKLRTTISEFGPILLTKILALNDTQASVLTVLLAYAKDERIPVVDLSDLKQLLRFASEEGKDKIEASYGGVSGASLKAILRKIISLETEVNEDFFSEPSFEVDDLHALRYGLGVINLLRLENLQAKPKLFSTFMLGLLDEVYHSFPEQGDPEKPKLIIFIDEAHLIFNHASNALLDKLETMVKLIRSKGVGLIFCTQSPKDIPEGILSQLGLKIQHALRAFTAKDRKAIKLIAENFPLTDYYDTKELLTSLGIGQALVTALDLNGQPTPLVQCMFRPPQSRMGIITDTELNSIVKQSHLVEKYAHSQDKQSAKDILRKKMEKDPEKFTQKIEQASTLEKLSKNTLFRQVVRTVFKEITNAVLSALGIKKTRRRKK